jgi:hypothetical protein
MSYIRDQQDGTPMDVVNGKAQVRAPDLENPLAGKYETVAASQTAQVLGSTGAAGEWLEGLLITPAVVACGVVTLLDGATSIPIFVGGATTALADAKPFYVPIKAKAATAWKVTTGANVSVIAVGNFT